MSKFTLPCLIAIATLLCCQLAAAQRWRGEPIRPDYEDDVQDNHIGEPGFMFVRGRYTNYLSGGGGRRRGGFGPPGGWWQTDFPDSDRNFLRGVRRYTVFDAAIDGGYRSVGLTDPELFEYSFLYLNFKRMQGSGNGPNLSPEEAASLREFMLRGGFVMIDDFWGVPHWNDFLIEFAKIFPDRDLVELPITHPIFHSFFDIKQFTQVPGRTVTWDYNSGFNLDDPNFPPTVHAVFDDDGRIMMVANHNTDLGDGWEHTFYEPYPTGYTNEAYKLGINYLVYAFSH